MRRGRGNNSSHGTNGIPRIPHQGAYVVVVWHPLLRAECAYHGGDGREGVLQDEALDFRAEWVWLDRSWHRVAGL